VFESTTSVCKYKTAGEKGRDVQVVGMGQMKMRISVSRLWTGKARLKQLFASMSMYREMPYSLGHGRVSSLALRLAGYPYGATLDLAMICNSIGGDL